MQIQESQEVLPLWQMLPLLWQEWNQNWELAQWRFRELIKYHERRKQSLPALLYRCALVQLQHGYAPEPLTGLGLDEAALRQQAGA